MINMPTRIPRSILRRRKLAPCTPNVTVVLPLESRHESGVGLVEVMIALSILLLSALAVSSLQTVGLLSATSSSVHFSIDHLSSEILETLRLRSVEANDGLLNLDSDEEDLSGVHPEVLSWLQRIEESIPTGEGSISCGSNVCDVSISWVEEIDGSRNRLFFRSSTPL